MGSASTSSSPTPRGSRTRDGVHPQIDYVDAAADALAGAEVVVLVTEWPEYRQLDPAATRALAAAEPTIIDGRNVLDPAAWRAAGWTYRGLGR